MALNSKKYFNRDLSWLQFNHRVLQEAADSRNPLYERIKFLAIFSANLDEFFAVRVSNMRQIKELNKSLRKKLITKPNRLLKEIKKQVYLQQEMFGDIFQNQLIPELKKIGVQIISHKEYTKDHQNFVADYFKENLRAQLDITSIDKEKTNQLFVEKEQLYLVSLTKRNQLIWVKIPDETPRFVMLPKEKENHLVTFVDDILKHNLTEKYGSSFYSIKISRDAELYIDNEYSGNLLEKIQASLSNRNTGQVTRALIDSRMPEEQLQAVMKALDFNETDVVPGGKYHNFRDFFGFPNPTNQQLTFKDLPSKRQESLQCINCIFEAIKSKDRLLYFPYESFEEVTRFVEEAAADTSVTRIKITLYRVSKKSAVATALLKAVKNGKDVCVFIETKARFDEANNIKWGKKLSQNGANVLYSYPGIKVHSKILYIERQEENKTKAYGYIGTGNFNEKTSKIYTDFGLMTANPKITSELLQVFQILERELIISKTKRLLVSPFTARSKFTALIEKEIANAELGKAAFIILKLNSLQDERMIDLLYKASNAGVKVRLLVRGICCLVPGIKGQSENIYITSIVDRFLEHARVYIFGNGGKEKMYMGSADWMTRNLDHRIEVIAPILDPDLFKKMRNAIQLQLDDEVKARIIDAKQKNEYVTAASDKESSQHLTYEQI